jgi:hypothetical protein
MSEEFVENEDGEVFHVTANDVWKVVSDMQSRSDDCYGLSLEKDPKDEDEEIIDDEADLTDLGVIEQHG